MKKRCDLNGLINEFDVTIKRKLYGMRSFNGFYDVQNYTKHLEKKIENLKFDMLYDLPFNVDGDKKIFLKNINTELLKKKEKLENDFESKIKQSFTKECEKIKDVRILLKPKVSTCRRLRLMYYLQYSCLNKALKIINQTADNYDIDLSNEESNCNLKNLFEWIGGDLEFLQFTYSLLNCKKVSFRKESEREAILQLATFFGKKLSQNSFTSLSRSIHSSNNDYIPSIFGKLTQSYENFVSYRRNIKNKRRE